MEGERVGSQDSTKEKMTSFTDNNKDRRSLLSTIYRDMGPVLLAYAVGMVCGTGVGYLMGRIW